MTASELKSNPYQNRAICVYFNKDEYGFLIEDAFKYRMYLDEMILLYPELFPSEIIKGYQMKDSYTSKKLEITARRILIPGHGAYAIRLG